LNCAKFSFDGCECDINSVTICLIACHREDAVIYNFRVSGSYSDAVTSVGEQLRRRQPDASAATGH
jgi:hypothetical protein